MAFFAVHWFEERKIGGRLKGTEQDACSPWKVSGTIYIVRLHVRHKHTRFKLHR